MNEDKVYYITELVAVSNILKYALDVNNFLNWIKDYHHVEDTNSILNGYIFFLKTAVNKFLMNLANSDAIELKSDLLFRRFTDGALEIQISELTDSSERAIFIKKVWALVKPIIKAKSWEILKNRITVFNNLLTNLLETLNSETRVMSQVTQSHKDLIIKVLTQYYLNFLFLNTEPLLGIPYAWLGSILEKTPSYYKKEEYLKSCFEGYKYTLEYLWYLLLDKNKYEKSVIKDLHNAEKIYTNGIKLLRPTAIIALIRDICEKDITNDERIRALPSTRFDFINNSTNNINEVLKHSEDFNKQLYIIANEMLRECSKLRVRNNWLALHFFYDQIEKDVVNHELKKNNINIDNIPETLYVSTPIEGEKLFSLLGYVNDSKKEHKNKSAKTSKKALFKKIETALLLSYPFDVLNVFVGSNQYHHGYALYFLLLGLATDLRFSQRNRLKKIYVRIFKHPIEGFNQYSYSYSYGILIQVESTTDISGWIIFFDCITDSYVYHIVKQEINDLIEQLKKDKLIDIIELEIPKDSFREFLIDRTSRKEFTDLLREIFNILETKLPAFRKLNAEKQLELALDLIEKMPFKINTYYDSLKGKFLELLLYYYLSTQKNKYDSVEWDKKINNEQIDIIAKLKNGNFEVYECTVALHQDNYEKKFEQAKHKAEIIERKFKTNATPILCTWEDINDKIEKYANAWKIKCINMKDLINTNSIFKEKERNKIREIFEY